MSPSVTPEISEVLKTLHYRPAVSIVMPFEPKINLNTELSHKLKIAVDKVERELLNNYPREVCVLVMRKIENIINNLNFNTHKKSIVIYVSLLFQKVIYLDIAVEEKIVIDESFEIRELLLNNQRQKKFLVLLLSGKESRMFVGDLSTLERVSFNIPETIYAYVNDTPERVSNFTDIQERKQITTYKFLYHIDSELDSVLSTYHLPIFVMGAEKLLGHFKKFTKHSGSVANYVHGNYEDMSLRQLEEILLSSIKIWTDTKQKELLNKLEEAAGKKKLAVGIRDVWREAANHRGQLLVVEKDYTCAAQHGAKADIIEQLIEPSDNVSFMRDAVDDIIENILINGGDVEFVDKNALKDYDHIALIQYY